MSYLALVARTLNLSMKMLFFLLAISFCSIIRESFKEEGEEVGVEEVEKGERAREGGI